MPRRSVRTDVDMTTLIAEINAKLDSPAFNGGFEALATNIKNLEQAISGLATKLDDLHRTVYDPDVGLFARVKKVEVDHREELEAHRHVLESLSTWRGELTAKDGPLERAADDHVRVDVLHAHKNRLVAFFVSTLGAAAVAAAKIIYDFFKEHVILH